MPHFSPSSGPSAGDEAARLHRILPTELQLLAKTFPEKNISIIQGLK
jgi:hypothetical protein